MTDSVVPLPKQGDNRPVISGVGKFLDVIVLFTTAVQPFICVAVTLYTPGEFTDIELPVLELLHT